MKRETNRGIGERRGGLLPQGNSLIKGAMSTGQLLRLQGSGCSKPHGVDFPGGPVVKTLPPNAGGEVPSLFGELRAHMPSGQKTKT